MLTPLGNYYGPCPYLFPRTTKCTVGRKTERSDLVFIRFTGPLRDTGRSRNLSTIFSTPFCWGSLPKEDQTLFVSTGLVGMVREKGRPGRGTGVNQKIPFPVETSLFFIEDHTDGLDPCTFQNLPSLNFSSLFPLGFSDELRFKYCTTKKVIFETGWGGGRPD